MLDPTFLPFALIQQAAGTLTDPRVQSRLLAELAQSQFLTEQFDAALQTLTAMPSLLERRVALLTADYQLFPPEKIGSLVQLLESDPRTQSLAGNLALSMLEAKNTRSAWTLIETAKQTFESESQRYEFLEKVLPQSPTEDWERIRRFRKTFTEEPYSDWATLAIAKYFASEQREDEAAKWVETFSSPLRRSWAYWELCRVVPPANHFFDKAINMMDTVDTKEEEQERLAIQLRILGRAACQRGNPEQGAQLLERSESAIASLTVPMQRYRLQCFLGKVLWELKLLRSIREYLPTGTMLESLPSSSDRSRLWVWLAEAGWEEGWVEAVNALAVPERGLPESDRAEQMASVLKRFVAHHQGSKASGNPTEDAVRISGEELESHYFTPFAEADCGC